MADTARDELRNLLQSKAGRVTAQQMQKVLARVDLLLDQGLDDEATLNTITVQHLVAGGIPVGVATVLKTMFPELPAASVAGAGVSGGDLWELQKDVKDLKVSIDAVAGAVLEHMSATVAASKAKKDVLESALKSANIVFMDWLDVDNNNSQLESLLLGKDEDQDDTFWDDSPEPAQRSEYATMLQRNVKLTRKLEWRSVLGRIVKEKVGGRNFSCKNDELISSRRFHSQPERGSIVGVELKKQLTWRGMRRAQVECVLFSSASIFPYIQIITDMTKGGVAFYPLSKDGGTIFFEQRALPSMEAVYDFMQGAVAGLPEGFGDVAADDPISFRPLELRNPKRIKIQVSPPGGPAANLMDALLAIKDAEDEAEAKWDIMRRSDDQLGLFAQTKEMPFYIS